MTYWRTRFDWRAAERRLNQFSQFTTNIDGLDVHFIHQRSSNPNALALAVTHGWPGSIAEFTKIIGPLTDPAAHGGTAADAFHVVAISLPGFGFSGKPTERGYSPERIAGVVAKLMARLGYTRYGLQGGDWGSSISRWTALNDRSHVVGLHVNFCLAGPPPGAANPHGGRAAGGDRSPACSGRRSSTPSAATSRYRARNRRSIGYGLDDSPAGLAAWIVEKFRSWSDSDGNVEKRFTKDELLTNITLYWVTQTGASSARIYFENARGRLARSGAWRCPRRARCFPRRSASRRASWVEAQYNLTRWTEMPRGGHFAAMEEPALLVDDIRAFFRTLR